MGSNLPTRSNTMLTVLMNIFHVQYREKKYPRKLKYFPWNVFDHSILSSIFCISCISMNNCLLSSSKAETSSLSNGMFSWIAVWGLGEATLDIFLHQLLEDASDPLLLRASASCLQKYKYRYWLFHQRGSQAPFRLRSYRVFDQKHTFLFLGSLMQSVFSLLQSFQMFEEVFSQVDVRRMQTQIS